MVFPKKQFSGLDIGSSGTKAVLLEGGSAPRLVSCLESLSGAEGILNEKELYQDIGLWLKENNGLDLPACLGIPQYYGSTLLADFPGRNRRTIARMVAFETQQLAGVSEEGFIHAYQAFPPAYGRKGPVMIGICNESAAGERLNSFREIAQGNPVSSALNALAMLNAFVALEPEYCKSTKPVLLLDLGQSSSTVVICAAGQPLYTGTLSFAAERFNKALSNREYQHLDGEGLQRLRRLRIQDENERSPMRMAARQLEDEIQQAVEHWRSSEKEDLVKTPVDAVFLCGGASQVGGLQLWLQNKLEVPVRIFGPQWQGDVHPEFVTAYGLALQAAGRAAVTIELLPESFRQQKKRRQRFPLLLAALAVFLIASSAWQVHQFLKLGSHTREIKQQTSELAVTGSLTDELERLQKQLLSHQNQLLPLLNAKNTMTRLRQTLLALAEACGSQDWFIYLGDEKSFFPAPSSAAQNRTGAGGFSFFSGRTLMDAALPVAGEEFPLRMLPGDVPACGSFISAGFTPFVPTQPYEQVRRIARQLQEKGGFPGLDILPERSRVEREDLFLPWLQLFKRLPGAQFRPFVFKMPLAPTAVAEDAVLEE